MSGTFNLLDEPWIPVRLKDGEHRPMGVKEALTNAGAIRCIVLSSPVDAFAVHRFLLTLLYWKADTAGGIDNVRLSLINGSTPREVLDGIIEEKTCFNLFDDQAPFLQDPSAAFLEDKDTYEIKIDKITGEPKNDSKRKSAGSLFAEFAVGTYIAHFHHGDDERMRLCLRCAVLGLISTITWSQSGGSGNSASVHGEPSLAVLAMGHNLSHTLGLNLVPLEGQAGHAKWSGHFKPTDPTLQIPYLEAFTWNPRRILLPPPDPGKCWRCGDAGVQTVGKIIYKKNVNTQKQGIKGDKKPFRWKDPAAFYDSKNADTKTKSEKQYQPLSAIMRRHGQPVLPNEISSYKSLVVERNSNHKGWLVVIPVTDKAKTFDYLAVETTVFSLETVKSYLSYSRESPASQTNKGIDGWTDPEPHVPKGTKLFVHAAISTFNYSDWTTLSNAAFCSMSESPAAFDIFTGLYWGLDNRHRRLPKRNAAWLTLKLMASVPEHARVVCSGTGICPIERLPKRQLDQQYKQSKYPVSFPRGRRLESVLRAALDRNMRSRNPQPVDWVGLCNELDQLLNKTS